jgi:polyisoprenoid-binding protein YceI
VFGFAGHDHHVAARALSGAVEVDPSDWSRSTVSLEFRSGALRVLEADEPPADVPEVQRVMLSPRVLDAERFPTVAFRSTRVTVHSADGGSGDLRIEGGLTLHGITQPVVVPVRVTMDPSGGLEAQGTCRVKQSAYGIEPPTAAGGTVRAKDEVIVRFQVKARR